MSESEVRDVLHRALNKVRSTGSGGISDPAKKEFSRLQRESHIAAAGSHITSNPGSNASGVSTHFKNSVFHLHSSAVHTSSLGASNSGAGLPKTVKGGGVSFIGLTGGGSTTSSAAGLASASGVAQGASGGQNDPAQLISSIEQLRTVLQSQADTLKDNTDALVQSTQKSSKGSGSSGGSILGNLFSSTIGNLFGIGSVVSGIADLFGGGSTAPAPLPQFHLPAPVREEAGLTSGNGIVPISYGANGLARSGTSAGAGSQQIHVNVQTMDSRSFLDNSDQIAQAVKEAMLNSHSINDVVADL